MAAIAAIEENNNQYSITWGSKPFRHAISAKYQSTYGLEFDPEREITVCCGATEGMIASFLAITNEGDEVIVFEPFYENYHPDTQLCGATRNWFRCARRTGLLILRNSAGGLLPADESDHY